MDAILISSHHHEFDIKHDFLLKDINYKCNIAIMHMLLSCLWEN